MIKARANMTDKSKNYGDLSIKAMRTRMSERLKKVKVLICGDENRAGVLENWKIASREM